MVFPRVEDVPFRCRYLLHGVDAGVEIINGDLTVYIAHAVEVVAPILDFGDTEGRAGKIAVSNRIILHHGQARLFGVCKDEQRVFAFIELDGAYRVVDQIPVRRFGFRHGICPRLQFGQVNLAILVGGVLFGESTADLFNEEGRIDQRLHCFTVQLDKVHTRL